MWEPGEAGETHHQQSAGSVWASHVCQGLRSARPVPQGVSGTSPSACVAGIKHALDHFRTTTVPVWWLKQRSWGTWFGG